MAYARAGATAKAEEMLRRLQSTVDLQSPQSRSFLHSLEGELALARGNSTGAIELILLADREYASSETIANLARACDVAGQTDQAIENYRRLLAKGRDSLGWEPQQLYLVAHIRLAEIFRDRGEKENAAQVLQPLADLWRDADTDLPLAARVRKLAGISGIRTVAVPRAETRNSGR